MKSLIRLKIRIKLGLCFDQEEINELLAHCKVGQYVDEREPLFIGTQHVIAVGHAYYEILIRDYKDLDDKGTHLQAYYRHFYRISKREFLHRTA